jgi:hypothetical protein
MVSLVRASRGQGTMPTANFVIIHNENSRLFGGWSIETALGHARDLQRFGRRINRIEQGGDVVLQGKALEDALQIAPGWTTPLRNIPAAQPAGMLFCR